MLLKRILKSLLASKPSRFVRYPLRIVKSLQQGANLAPAPWYEIALRKRDFQELRGRIRADPPLWEFVESSVRYGYISVLSLQLSLLTGSRICRYDYSAATGILVFRRPTPFHASIISKLVAEIESLLVVISQANTAAGAFTGLLRADVSPALYLIGSEDDDGPPFSRRHPDAAFWHVNARWPGVVIEITNGDKYAGKRRSMFMIAKDCILKTDGEIRVVVSLAIDSESSIGSISTWRAVTVHTADGWSGIHSVPVQEGVVGVPDRPITSVILT